MGIDVRDIVSIYLTEHKFDGLFNSMDGCACVQDDLMPCEYSCGGCEPGYKVPCPNIGNTDPDKTDCECDPDDKTAWHVQKEK